jgi:septal ring factor EnvC (AmiA/AmiB activator)
MAKFKSILFAMLVTGVLSGSIVGCGGGVDEEQMAMLNNLKAEVESLNSQVKAKQDEKASLQKQIADKDAKLKKCMDDTQKTKSCLDSWGK